MLIFTFWKILEHSVLCFCHLFLVYWNQFANFLHPRKLIDTLTSLYCFLPKLISLSLAIILKTVDCIFYCEMFSCKKSTLFCWQLCQDFLSKKVWKKKFFANGVEKHKYSLMTNYFFIKVQIDFFRSSKHFYFHLSFKPSVDKWGQIWQYNRLNPIFHL